MSSLQGNLSVGRFGLDPETVASLRDSGIRTVSDFVGCDVDRIIEKTPSLTMDLHFIQKTLITQLAGFILTGSCSYNEMMSSLCILPTGCDHLDELLDGGLYTGEITEFVGAAGVGKSQVCMSISIFTAMETKKNILYIDTGGGLCVMRMKEMLMRRNSTMSDKEVYNVLSRIIVVQAFDIHTVFDTLESLRQSLSDEENNQHQHIKVIIVDCVACVVGPILGGQQILGHSLMINISRTLKALAVHHSLAVMVTNNVVSDAKTLSSTKPALGPSWAHIPNTRVFIERTPPCDQSEKACAVERVFTVTKSSRQRLHVATSLYINRGGLYSVKPIATEMAPP